MTGSRTAAGVTSRRSPEGVALEGEFSLAAIDGLLDESRGWFTAGGSVAIDLGGIRRTDSSGVVLMLEWQRQARKAGCQLRFSNPPEQMRSLVRFYQVEDFLSLP
jgi:phospholipid transport system transporter-binding protein